MTLPKLLKQPRKLPTPPVKLRKKRALPLARLHKLQVKPPSPPVKQVPMPQHKPLLPQAMPLPPLQMQPRPQVKLPRKQRPSRRLFIGRTLYGKTYCPRSA